MSIDRGQPVQNRVLMAACIVIILATILPFLLTRHVALRDGWSIVLSLIASARLFQESRKPKFRKTDG